MPHSDFVARAPVGRHCLISYVLCFGLSFFYACLPSTCRQRIVTHTPCWSGQTQACATRFIAFRLTNQQPLLTLLLSLSLSLSLLCHSFSFTLTLCFFLLLALPYFKMKYVPHVLNASFFLPQPQPGSATIAQFDKTHTHTHT